MNRESVWNIEPVTHDEKPNNPTGCVQGAFNHFPGMDFRAVDGAGEEGFTGNQLILVIQIQHPEGACSAPAARRRLAPTSEHHFSPCAAPGLPCEGTEKSAHLLAFR